MQGARVLRLVVVLIASGTASIEGGCRSAVAIGGSTDLNIRSAPQAPAEPLPRPGTVAASLLPGGAMEAVRSRCVACHEPAMLLQQRLTAQQWMVEIDKMQGWGAPVANEDKSQLASYLATIAGPDNTRFAPAIVGPISTERSTRNPAEQR